MSVLPVARSTEDSQYSIASAVQLITMAIWCILYKPHYQGSPADAVLR